MRIVTWLVPTILGALVGAAAWASIKHFAYINIGWTAWLIAVLVGLCVWVVAPTGIRGSPALNLDPAARMELKARRRTCRRRRVLISLGVVAAIIGGLTMRVRLGMLPYVDYTAKITELCEQQLPPSARGPDVPNEWPRFQRLMDQVVEVDRSLGGAYSRGSGKWFADFREATVDRSPRELAEQQIRAAITLIAYEEAGIFDALREIVACPKLFQPIEPIAIARLHYLVGQGQAHHLMSVLNFSVQQSISRGAADDAVRSLELLCGVRRILELQPAIIEQAYAVACRAVSARGITRSVPAAGLDHASLQQLLQHVQRMARWPAMSCAAECRRLANASLLQSVYHDRGDSQVFPSWFQPVFLAFARTQSQQQRTLDELCDQAAASSELPFAQHRAAENVIIDRIDRFEFFDAPLKMVIGPLTVSAYHRMRADCEAGGAILILAIELHRARHDGRPPDSLDDLIPGELAELPRDPFAPDGCFIYRSLAEVPGTAGPPYMLYSVGTDQTDDGGLVPMTWNRDQGQALDLRRLDDAPCDHVFTALSQEGWAVRLAERPRLASPPR